MHAFQRLTLMAAILTAAVLNPFFPTAYAGDPPRPDGQAKINLLSAIDRAAEAVPGSKVVRLELHGKTYEVVVVTKEALLGLEVDAATGKASATKPAEMDGDEFRDAESALKCIAAARLGLADAVRLAERGEKGRATEAEIKQVRGQPRYEVKIARDAGSVEVHIDGIKGAVIPQQPRASDGRPYRDQFAIDKKNLVATGRNPYFILEPGYCCHYAGGKETLVITVLKETKLIDGVETRVVKEREEKSGKLAEVSRNYFAIDKTTNDVYYFGEDVDIYRDGKVVEHEGAWRAGVNGAKFGLMMPGQPKAGDRFYQELAPTVAMDRAEIISLETPLKTPGGNFDKCLYIEESSPLESGRSKKWYAPGVGLVRDDEVMLVKVQRAQP